MFFLGGFAPGFSITLRPMRCLGYAMMFVSAACGDQPVTLAVQPDGQYKTTYLLSAGPALQATVRLSGHLDARVELDRDGGRVERFRFTGGRVAYSNETAKALLTPFPPTYAEIRTRGVASGASTPGRLLRPVDPVTGFLKNSEHRFSQNEGEVITRILVSNVEVQKEVRNLAATPDTNPLFGSTEVRAVLLSENALVRRHRIELVQTGGEPRTQPVPELNATLTIVEVGGFTAHGEVVGPSRAMMDWAEQGGLRTPVSIDEPHPESGLPLGILYSLGRSTDDGRQPLEVDAFGRTARLELPAAGPVHPVAVEFSTTGSGWKVLAVYSPGDGGLRVLDLPEEGAVFVRLRVSAE